MNEHQKRTLAALLLGIALLTAAQRRNTVLLTYQYALYNVVRSRRRRNTRLLQLLTLVQRQRFQLRRRLRTRRDVWVDPHRDQNTFENMLADPNPYHPSWLEYFRMSKITFMKLCELIR